MNKMNDRSFRDRLTVRLFRQFTFVVAVFTIVLAGIFLLGYFIGHNVIDWHGPLNFAFKFVKTIDNFKIYIFILVWVIGFLVITISFWRKTIGYATQMINSIEGLYGSDTDLVNLPDELKDVEDRLNQIKYNSLRNQQLAREAEQRKNDLVVYLAHDLKTPLTSVIGYLTLLRDEQQISPELREKYLSISVEKAERLETLINEFFEITRFNLNEMVLETTKVNLTRMLEQITDEFKPMMLPKGLTCKVKAEKDILIHCDVKKLDRVFDNLIRNSINYSYENSEILITATLSEQVVTLKFRNHGDTIPEQKLNHIFEQFYRLDMARTTQSGGAGLGLAIAKEIIDFHGGSITAYSENDIIEFTIELPVELIEKVGKS